MVNKMERKPAKKNTSKNNLMSKIRVFVMFKCLLKGMNEMGKKYKNAKETDKIELYQMKTILKELVKAAVKLVDEGVCGKEHVRLFMSLRLAEYIRLAVAENHRNSLIFKVTKDGDYQNLYKGTASAIAKLIKIQKAIEVEEKE